MKLCNPLRTSVCSNLTLLAALAALPVQGQIAFTGDYIPVDPFALDVDPSPAILDIGMNDVLVGLFAPATLDITNGWSLINGDGLLGQSNFSSGIVTIDGPGSAWINRGSVDVGGLGTGSVNLVNGGTLEALTLNIAPLGNLNWDDGTIRITGGSANALLSGTTLYLGEFGKTSHLELVGAASSLNSGLLLVGESNTGSLRIDGATVTSNNSYIGYYSSGTGTATITGGQWNTSGDLVIGASGDGTLYIDGGTVTAGNSTIAMNPTSTGIVNITAGHWITSGDLGVGLAGSGTLDIDGGIVEAQNLIIHPNGTVNWAAGTVRIQGGTAPGLTDASNDLLLGQAPGTTQSLELMNGASFDSSNSEIGAGSGSTGSVVVGSASIWTNTGTINVGGAGTGTLTLQGGTVQTQSIDVQGAASNLFWTDGTLRIEGGTAAGIASPGSDVLLLGQFNASLTQQLELVDGASMINASSVLGQFPGATGIVKVQGSGSTWIQTGDLDVGFNGNGTLLISGGGTVDNNDAFLGWNASGQGEVTIDGTNSTWINSGIVDVGNDGTGILNIDNGGTLEANSFNVHPTNGTLNWTDGTVRITGGSASGLLNATNDLRLGTLAGTTQKLELSAGATLNASRTYVGDAANTTGTLLIDGVGTSMNNTGNANIGYLGQGDVLITDGGSMTAYNAYVGNAGQGELVITAGGSMIATRDIFIGFQAGALGEVTVDGPDALLSGRSVFAGYNGAGTLNILNGGTVEAVSFRVFDTLNWADGTLRIKGSNVTGLTVLNNELRLGSNGVSQAATQNLELTQGTRLSVGTANIGKYFQNIGTLTVDGAGSSFGGTTTTLGGQGTGQLIVSNGGSANATTANLERNGTATITGPGSVWTIATTFNLESGELEIFDGGVVNSTAFATDVATGSATAQATVDGAGSVWNNNGHLRVGVPGRGLLTIRNGGSVNNAFGYIGYQPSPSGTSSVFVTGQDSSWINRGDLIVARGIAGALNIADGGSVSNQNATIGLDAGAAGSVNVNGAGASWISSGVVNVGVAGTGTLGIFGGSVVEAQSLFIHPTNGTLNWGNGTIRINGGTATGLVDGNNELWIGETQHLELVNGATHSSSRAFIGYGFGQTNPGSGSVRVEGAGSLWNNTGDIFVGFGERFPSPRGTLTVVDGGQVNSKDLRIGNDAGSSGFVTVTGPGSRLNTTGQVYVGRNGGGTLRVQDGGVVEGPYGSIDRGNATIQGPGSTWNITTGGLLLAYFGPGELTIANGGHVSIADDLRIGLLGAPGTLNFTLGSLADPLFDVGGNATLAGTINVDVDSGLSLADGDAFTLIDIVGVQTGAFGNVAQDELLGTFGGVDLFLSYTGGDGNDVVAYALAVAVTPGDTDGDGDVDDSDLGTSFSNYTGPVGAVGGKTTADGDMDGDGDVDDSDLGTSFSSYTGPVAVNIPEPTSLALLCLGGLFLARSSRSASFK